MTSPASTVELLELVRKSGLVHADLLDQRLREVPNLPGDPVQSAAVLVQRGLLTRFQAKLLLSGRYRGFKLGSYVIQEQIGQGGMGTVYRAEHETLRRRVAVKVLTPPKGDSNAKLTLERFQTPADVIRALAPWLSDDGGTKVVAGLSGTDLAGSAEMQTTLNELRAGGTARIRRSERLAGKAGRPWALWAGAAAGVLAAVGGPVLPSKSPAAVAPAVIRPPAAGQAFVPLPLGGAAVARSEDVLGGRNRLSLFDWGPKEFKGVPFRLLDPAAADEGKNVIGLYSSNTARTNVLPKSVALPVDARVAAVHVLGGVSGWEWPCTKGATGIGAPLGTPSVVVRVRYADGPAEEHVWKNGEHLADYSGGGRRDVPGSEFAFELQNRHQVRYLAVRPARDAVVREVEVVELK